MVLLIAAGLFAANAAYGYLRVSQPPAEAMRVALIDSNTYGYWAQDLTQTNPKRPAFWFHSDYSIADKVRNQLP